mgnify:CR=1 FL=1
MRDCLPLLGEGFFVVRRTTASGILQPTVALYFGAVPGRSQKSGCFCKLLVVFCRSLCYTMFRRTTGTRDVPPQCTAAARVGSPLNTTLCCQSNHSGRNVSWMPTATLPPCTTPCHPVCRGRSFWPPCACRISAATTPTWKSGGCPGSTAPPCVTPRWAAED